MLTTDFEALKQADEDEKVEPELEALEKWWLNGVGAGSGDGVEKELDLSNLSHRDSPSYVRYVCRCVYVCVCVFTFFGKDCSTVGGGKGESFDDGQFYFNLRYTCLMK